MPELPDVRTFKGYFDATSLHERIDSVHVRDSEILEETSPQGLGRHLNGKRFDSTFTHGKHLFAILDGGGALVLHFGMTGFLEAFSGDTAEPEHTKLRIDFTSGSSLAYVCTRKLGLIGFTKDPEAYLREKGVGPDAMEIDQDAFVKLLSGRRGMIKSTLMNQDIIAGIGNVYSDEILYQTGVHPETPVDALSEDTLLRLHSVMVRVFETVIRNQADPERMPSSYLTPHRGEDSAACPKCGGSIQSRKVSGRTAYFCPSCQTK